MFTPSFARVGCLSDIQAYVVPVINAIYACYPFVNWNVRVFHIIMISNNVNSGFIPMNTIIP